MYQQSFVLKIIRVTVKLAWLLSCLLVMFALFQLFTFIISPEENFSVTYMYNAFPNQWLFKFKFETGQSIGAPLSSLILDHSSQLKETPKIVMILIIVFKVIPRAIFSLLTITLIGKIIKDLFDVSKAFTMKQVKYTKYISYMILVYYLAFDLMLNLVFTLYTHNNMIRLENIHLSGLLYAGLVYLIAELLIFGVFLQGEYDTTL